MDKLTIKTPFGPVHISAQDNESVYVDIQPNDDFVVNRVGVKCSSHLVVGGGGYVENLWTYYTNDVRDKSKDRKHSWYLRRSQSLRLANYRSDDSLPHNCYQKAQQAIIAAVNEAIANHPELLLAGRVNEYQDERRKALGVITKAKQEIAEAEVILARLEASLTPEMKAYIVERSLGGKQEE